MKKTEKILSRDMALMDMYVWRNSLIKGLNKFLGWSYSDVVFYFHDKYSDVVLLSEEHYGKFLKSIIKRIQKNPKWFVRKYDNFLLLTRDFFDFFKKSKQVLKKKNDNKELWSIFYKYSEYMKKHFGPFVIMKWLPIWLENNPSLSKKFFSEIKLAVSARKISEKTLPQGRELCNLICNIIEKRFSNLKGCSRFIDYNELKGLLLNDKAPNLKKIKSRTNGFIYSKKGTLNTGNELKKIKETFNKLGYSHNFTLTSNIKEFGGQSAFLGCVRGTVKLIMVKKEIMDIKNGEVLVTSMTTPEYLPAMKKSIAFITDEGGITCHAAIIAREMRKPCIIGTKIATQILKSGDKVEVDADKGIVKILN